MNYKMKHDLCPTEQAGKTFLLLSSSGGRRQPTFLSSEALPRLQVWCTVWLYIQRGNLRKARGTKGNIRLYMMMKKQKREKETREKQARKYSPLIYYNYKGEETASLPPALNI